MVTAADIQQRFNIPRSAKRARTVDTTLGRLIYLSGSFFLSQDGAGQYVLSNNFGDLPGSALTPAQAATNATTLQNLHFANHLHVKQDARWRHMYHYKNRDFRFKRANGNYQVRQLASYPCHYCGMYLPEEFIEVDHRQPQSKPGGSIIKVLRAINANFAGAAAVGTKAGQIANLEANNVHQLNTIPVSEYDWANAWQHGIPLFTPRRNRYTITSQGQTFLTICGMLWGDTMVKTMCLNSIINLVPACRMCNGAQGKGSKLYATQ